MTRVAAVAPRSAGGPAAGQAAAIAGQTAAGTVELTIAATIEAGHRSGAELLWMLDGGAVPGPDALEHLLGAISEPGAAALVTGLPLDERGVPLDGLTPRGVQELPAMLAAAPRRRMAVRYAHLSNTLVRREAVDRHGLPRPALGPYAAREWTSRVLEGGSTWLVPQSRVTRPPEHGSLRDLPAAVRMARTDACTGWDAIRGFAGFVR